MLENALTIWHIDLEEGEESVIFRTDGSVASKGRDGDGVGVEDGQVVREEAVKDQGALEPGRQQAAHEGDEGGALQGVQQLCLGSELVHRQVGRVPDFGHRNKESILDAEVDVVW